MDLNLPATGKDDAQLDGNHSQSEAGDICFSAASADCFTSGLLDRLLTTALEVCGRGDRRDAAGAATNGPGILHSDCDQSAQPSGKALRTIDRTATGIFVLRACSGIVALQSSVCGATDCICV